MHTQKKLRIQKDFIGKRADIALLKFMPQLTRTTAKKLFVEGIIKVNDNIVKPNYRVSENDIFSYSQADVNSYLDLNRNAIIKPSFKSIGIVYEDENIIVVDKPEGIVSHPVLGHRDDSVLNRLVGLMAQREKDTTSNTIGAKLRLVHRLDRDTSGVLLVAKNIETQQYYSRQFEQGLTHKTYFAVVKGDFKRYLVERGQDFLLISSYIARSSQDKKVYINSTPQKGQLSKTKVYFENYWHGLNGKYSVLKIEPETGRTHQIRVHLSSVGFCIVGDVWYSGVKYKRMMLHSFRLEIPDPNGNTLVFNARLPAEFI